MKVYLVGGAVRDRLLNLPVKEQDWVVVGASPDELLKNDFDRLGKISRYFCILKLMRNMR